MWSKTKKKLKDRTADKLKNRVDYDMHTYRTSRNIHPNYDAWDAHALYVSVDGKPWFVVRYIFLSNFECDALREDGRYELVGGLGIQSQTNRRNESLENFWSPLVTIQDYLNDLSIEECLSNEDSFMKLLVILDRRIGKRRLRQLYAHYEEYPKWLQRFLILRMESEGMDFKEE